jgi:protein SCO1/2
VRTDRDRTVGDDGGADDGGHHRDRTATIDDDAAAGDGGPGDGWHGDGGNAGNGDGDVVPAPARPDWSGARPVRIAVLVAVTALVLGIAAVLAAGRDGDTETGGDGATEARGDDAGWHGAVLHEPAPRPDFTLTDTAGAPYDFRAETTGRLTLLFFGYTSCPDVCPIHMATLSAALEQPGMPDPIVVFVTTDPERDTPERLRSWLDNFGTDFVGLTGTPEQIAAAEDAAGVARSIVAAEDAGATPEGDYEVGHAAQIIAYTPDDVSHLQYPFGVRRQDWEADLPRMLDTWGAPVVAVQDAWAAADDVVTAVYLTIDNGGDDDRLVAATTDVAGRVSVMGPGVAMPAGGGTEEGGAVDLAVPAGTTDLAPGGTHLMFEQLARPLRAGEEITVRLSFARAGEVDVPVEILDWDEVAERAGAR